jgi:KDO2-lipid IV(A) lauroyltransferase
LKDKNKATINHFLQFAPIWVLLKLGRVIPFEPRVALVGKLGGFLVRHVPILRNRALHQINRVYPNKTDQEKLQLCKDVGSNTGRSLCELLNNDELAQKAENFTISGEGLSALKKAVKDGTGALVVSGHFGQWEGIRHAMRRIGCPAGAIYKPNANDLYENHFVTAIKKGGEPIVKTGSNGSRQMVRHIRNGGFFAILPDQRVGRTGTMIPFLGHDASTSTAAAELALRYKIPLIPAYGTRIGNSVEVDFEAPIEHTDPVTMMTAVNNSLSARVFAKPEQWYWLHHRWDKPKK